MSPYATFCHKYVHSSRTNFPCAVITVLVTVKSNNVTRREKTRLWGGFLVLVWVTRGHQSTKIVGNGPKMLQD